MSILRLVRPKTSLAQILPRLAALLHPMNDAISDPEAARAHQRRHFATVSAAASLLAKSTSVGVMLLTVPLTLHYLGAERYGMWLILSSLAAMLSFADFGIGNGLLNSVAAAHGRDDTAVIRQAVSSGTAALVAIAIVIMAAFACAYRLVQWSALFNVHSPLARTEAGPAIATFVACFALAIPASIVQRVQMGLQRGFVASLWQCGGSIVSLIAVLIAIELKAGLPWLVLAFLGGPLLSSVMNSVAFFGWMRKDIRPSLGNASWAAAAEVMRIGGLFFLLQVAAAVCYNSDNFIIAQILGAAVVPQYAVPERLFSLITMAVTMVVMPLWPAYREAIVRGDIAWARRTLTRSLGMMVSCAAIAAGALVILAPFIIRMWVGPSIQAPFMLIVGLGLWKVAEAGGLALAMFLNGAHVMKPQLYCASATAVASITLEIALVRYIGVAGAVWATLIAYALLSLAPFAFIIPPVLRDMGCKRQRGA